MKRLFNWGILWYLGRFVQEKQDVQIQKLGLRGILDMLNLQAERVPKGFSKSVCRRILERNNVKKAIERLQNHSNSKVAGLARKITETLFQSQDKEFRNILEELSIVRDRILALKKDLMRLD